MDSEDEGIGNFEFHLYQLEMNDSNQITKNKMSSYRITAFCTLCTLCMYLPVSTHSCPHNKSSNQKVTTIQNISFGP